MPPISPDDEESVVLPERKPGHFLSRMTARPVFYSADRESVYLGRLFSSRKAYFVGRSFRSARQASAWRTL